MAQNLTDFELEMILGCKKGKGKSQEMLYKHYFGYALTTSLSYSTSRDEAMEIVDDSFMKVFSKIDQFDINQPFKGWLRRIIINTSIDYYRKTKNHKNHMEISEASYVNIENENAISSLTAEDILNLLKQLPEIYRITFNLYEIEGYNHEEIAEMLNIPASSSRVYLSRAKEKLRSLYQQHFLSEYERSVR